jgi:hypothetical protein
LLSKASEVIFRDRDKEIFRLGMSEWFSFFNFHGKCWVHRYKTVTERSKEQRLLILLYY